MATGPEHYLQAEELLEAVHFALSTDPEDAPTVAVAAATAAAAQVHATLALAAATAGPLWGDEEWKRALES